MADPLSLSLVLQGGSLSSKITQLLSVMSLVDAKLDKIIQVELKTGISHLKYAMNASSEGQQMLLLQEARNCFQKAVHLESGTKNEAISLLGLACCYQWMGEAHLSQIALDELLDINPIPPNTISGNIRANMAYVKNYILPFRVLVQMLLTVIAIPFTTMRYIVNVITFGLADKMLITRYVNELEDVNVIYNIQLFVSSYVGKPTPWRKAYGFKR